MDESGEVVLPASPGFLPNPISSKENKLLNRLDLAHWIVDPENPLTARTFANRIWDLYFGMPLSSAPEDLGQQGEFPPYPELLDWLAAEFIESGWDIKHLVRLIVTSNTYRQSSDTSDDNEKIYKALSLGVRDYLHKCGFASAVIGLSGGIDSAVTAVIAVDALGADNVRGVAMPSQYSSQGSLDDAEGLAKALGIQYDVVPIEPVFEQLKSQMRNIFEGHDEDTTEENMQARLRGNILMSMSNKFGSLLLTTGNKSELAVGYCTLYGDMCGGLAVISDLPKTKVYSLAKWINREREIIPESTLAKPPSAELRPDQVDQDSLPPYDVLDSILEAYVVDGQDAEAIIASGHDEATVQRIIRLININEYKRRQAAPGIKITSKAFGVGRRIPVAKRFS